MHSFLRLERTLSNSLLVLHRNFFQHMIKGKKLVVILPAYNAAKTLKQTYDEIPFDIVDDVVLVDDMVDTAGTLTKAADLMMEKGALSVRAVCTHAILSGAAYEKIEASKLTELIVTDSIPLKQESPKVRVLSCAPLFAQVMYNVHHNQSISSKFII